MKIAFAIWNNRIAPVFDTVEILYLVEIEKKNIVARTETAIHGAAGVRASLLGELGAQALVCGAISRPLQDLVESQGVKVTPFITGEIDEVVDAWLAGRLGGDAYAMPGCCGRRRGHRRGAQRGQYGEPAVCLCPQCGHRAPHRRGEPCSSRRCPQCGAAMTRGNP